MKNKIFPRNLTAHLAHNVAGNPAVSRLESSVANCFPGLEIDVRNLDRRFFPGLLFDYVGGPDAGMAQTNQQGMKLVYVDTDSEPMLPESSMAEWQQMLLDQYNGAAGDALGDGNWYLHSIEQGGNRIELYQVAYFENSAQKIPYEAETVYWLVRGLNPDEPVTIELIKRDEAGALVSPPIALTGYRRRYLTDAGALSDVYLPGELTESMCSPWTHDFRDCACHYWAASHPDVVLGEVDGKTLPDGGSRDPIAGTVYLDWLRADRGLAGKSQSAPTITVQRPLRIDHYAINQVWEELAFVVAGREIGDVMPPQPGRDTEAKPYGSIAEMIDALENELAPLELTLAVQYLYALFSMRDADEAPKDRWPSLTDDLGQVRQFLTLVAAGEMQHLRWANQLIWELCRHARRTYRPVLEFAKALPDGSKPTLARLEPAVLDRFIDYERPRGEIFRAYARCVATLRDARHELPSHLYELAARIDTDGLEHFTRFRDLRTVLKAYAGAENYPYLRDVRPGDDYEAERALDNFRAIVDNIGKAYASEASGRAKESQRFIVRARAEMQALNTEGERLAREGIGIPFLRAFRG